jgi:hypothetical protein
VVGSAGNLSESAYGKIIDSHDVVYRMNDAPIAGYERDVGTKTSVRVVTGLGTFPSQDADELILSKNILNACRLHPDFVEKNKGRILALGDDISEKTRAYFPSNTYPSMCTVSAPTEKANTIITTFQKKYSGVPIILKRSAR